MSYIFLSISLLINLLSFLYIKWLLRTVATMEIQTLDIWNLVSEFKIHLKSVYELEMFYGDETLKSLMDHANQITESLDEFESVIQAESEEANPSVDTESN